MLRQITYNVDFYSRKNSFKLLVFLIDQCNYQCTYCYNDFPRTSKKIDINKLYYFITQILIKKLKKQYIYLEIIGGEPTLHNGLLDFCKKISLIPNVYTTIFSNFTQLITYYKQLLDIDNRIKLILSWHSTNTQFIDKLKLFSITQLSNNIIASIIFEHDNIALSLNTFDTILNNHNYIYGLDFPLIDNTDNYVKIYSDSDIILYNEKIQHVKDNTHIKIIYDNNTHQIVNQYYFITNEQNKCYKYWLCNAGIDFCFIYFNGNISVCDAYKETKILGNIYSGEIDQFNLNTTPVLCKIESCPCVFDIFKKRVFKH